MTKIKVRFFGFLNPINGRPQSWDYVEEFDSETAAAEAVADYVAEHDDGIAHYEWL